MRVVVDTNVFISAALKEDSPPGTAVHRAATGHLLLKSKITERIAVCRDPKDDKFLELAVTAMPMLSSPATAICSRSTRSGRSRSSRPPPCCGSAAIADAASRLMGFGHIV
jgi:hypothetical protein